MIKASDAQQGCRKTLCYALHTGGFTMLRMLRPPAINGAGSDIVALPYPPPVRSSRPSRNGTVSYGCDAEGDELSPATRCTWPAQAVAQSIEYLPVGPATSMTRHAQSTRSSDTISATA
jgi:hypothetical protein